MNQGLLRIVTAAAGIPLVLGAFLLGGPYLLVLVAVIGLGGQWELLSLLRQRSWPVDPVWALAAGALVLARFAWPWWDAALLVLCVAFAIRLLRDGPEGKPLERLAANMLSVGYPVVVVSLLLPIRERADMYLGDGEAFMLTFLLFAVIWACDSAAYYTGKSLGRHKLAPGISPNKTWEGTIGGVLGAVVVGFLFQVFWLPALSTTDVLVLVAIGGGIGQMGDLLESAFKRSAGVKDSGTLLPGHGGFLDRFDAVFLAMPLYYVYLLRFSSILA